MIICICNALKDKDLQKACSTCPSDDPEAVMGRLGCKPKCGKCLCFIEDIITENTRIVP